jgi:diguanylate cyclase (GGDEF)-like protein
VIEDKLSDEEGRLAALGRYEILDTAEEESFNQIVNLVHMTLQVPIAAVTFIGRDRQAFKAVHGLARDDTSRDIAFCNHTISQNEPLSVPDALADPRFSANPRVAGAPYIRSYLGVPLTTPDGYNVGSVCASDTKPRAFDPTQIAIMQSLAKLVVEQLELRQIAKQDPMTDALTRRGFFAEVEKDFKRSRRYERPSALVVIDVDSFKAINDGYGHPAGDEVLVAISRICNQTLRQSDRFGRIGGDEFALLLPETNADEALQCAERIRAQIADLRVKSGSQTGAVSASFGVAPLAPDIGHPDQWFVEADIALYEAKRDGRNRSVVAKPRRPNLAPAVGAEVATGIGLHLH